MTIRDTPRWATVNIEWLPNDAGTTTGSRWYVTEAVLHLKGENRDV